MYLTSALLTAGKHCYFWDTNTWIPVGSLNEYHHDGAATVAVGDSFWFIGGKGIKDVGECSSFQYLTMLQMTIICYTSSSY